MREKNRNSIESNLKLPQFTTMNVIDGQAGCIFYSSLILCSLTIDNILNIIVLLILAGVTIVTLTGDNGILTKAGDAKNTSQDAEIEEEIRLAWNKVYADDSINNYTAEQKASALQAELIGKDTNATVSASGNKLSVKYRGKDKVLDISSGSIKEPSAVAKAISAGTVFDQDNTPITDEYKNTVIIPKGFKLSKDSAEVVTEGIVIEDATYTNTKGSEFVWIPVSKDSTDANKVKGTKNTTILLSRYTFDSNGNPNNQGANTINYFYTELASSQKRNAVAKNIEDFKTKTKAAGGFWIGRYEARTTSPTARSSITNSLTSVTEKPENSVYNYITQPNASAKAIEMYEENSYFESDLINSYAWDTATLFLQEYDNRTGSNLTKYSLQNNINGSLLATGTVSETNKDKICNVYDMASNCYEWTTETCSVSGCPCVLRGGYYGYSSYCTCYRGYTSTTDADGNYSFRPVLYVR